MEHRSSFSRISIDDVRYKESSVNEYSGADFLYTEPQIAIRESKLNFYSDSTLCKECASLDITSLVAETTKTDTYVHVCNVRHVHLQHNKSSCPLCDVIIWMLQTFVSPEFWSCPELIMYRDRRITLPLHRHVMSSHMAVFLRLKPSPGSYDINQTNQRKAEITSSQLLPNKSICPTRSISINREFTDYEPIKRYLSTCNSMPSHINDCTPQKRKQNWPSKLIDCQNLTIVTAQPTYAYVALSYVWGQQHHDPSKSLRDSPTTIRDAIKVTIKLDYRYLWVDRYCIDQHHSTEKHAEIQQMGRIYNGASLTIIAAVGSDPSYGLPGVSIPRASIIPKKIISNWMITGIRDYPFGAIRQSVWMTRAWTYQEALLSRRRLYFTDQQTYFECQNCSHEELWLDNEHIGATIPRLFNNRPIGDSEEEVFKYIAEYSRRHLTYEDDYLNGILGTLGCLAEGKCPVFHLFGVPVFGQMVHDRTLASINCTTNFLFGMSWIVREATRRRSTSSPSWSWVGWSGAVSWPTRIDSPICAYVDSEVWVEDDTQEARLLYDLCRQPHPSIRKYSLCRVIHIKSQVFAVTVNYPHYTNYTSSWFCWYRLTSEGELMETHSQYFPAVSWSLGDGLHGYAPLYPFENLKDQEMTRFKVLVLYSNDSSTQGKLIQETEGGYKVVGHVKLGLYDLYFHFPETPILPMLPAQALPDMVTERVRLL